MDYRVYKPKLKELFLEVIKIIIIGVIVGYLCFESVTITILLIIPISFIVLKQDTEKLKIRRQERLSHEFKDMIVGVSTGLNAGYSLENSLSLAQKEVRKLHGKNSDMEREIGIILHGISCGNCIEDMIYDLGLRSGIEEIFEFAELIIVAKRHGGNINKIIRRLEKNMVNNNSVKLEISTMIAAKRLEGQIMQVIPFVIIGYIRMTNPGYMDVLYKNILGVIFMAICLVVIVVANMTTNKIVNIDI